jgi:copper ion binding protein
MMIDQFRVPGMSCEHCVRAITQELSAVSGVSAVQVNLNDKSVRVEHDEKVGVNELISAINEAGYDDVAVLV